MTEPTCSVCGKPVLRRMFTRKLPCGRIRSYASSRTTCSEACANRAKSSRDQGVLPELPPLSDREKWEATQSLYQALKAAGLKTGTISGATP